MIYFNTVSTIATSIAEHVNKLVPGAFNLSGAFEVWRLRLNQNVKF